MFSVVSNNTHYRRIFLDSELL